MIKYDPGEWNISFAFTLQGSVFPKAFVIAFPSALFAAALNVFVFSEYPEVSSSVGFGETATTVLGGFTFILGFLIVFRTQLSYARWWEGAALLKKIRGEWFNAFSSLTAFCNTNKVKHNEVLNFQHQLVRLFSLLHASALHQLGKECCDENVFELITIEGFDAESMNFLMSSADRCEIVLQWIQRLIVHANNADIIKIAPPILARVYNQLGNGIVGLCNARKIAEFYVPFCLAQMITFMLFLHWLVTPIVCASSVTNPYLCSVITFVVIFSYWSINYIATELEIPFGSQSNDLPLPQMQKELNESLKALLSNHATEPPAFQFNKSRHEQLISKDIDMNGHISAECAITDPDGTVPTGYTSESGPASSPGFFKDVAEVTAPTAAVAGAAATAVSAPSSPGPSLLPHPHLEGATGINEPSQVDVLLLQGAGAAPSPEATVTAAPAAPATAVTPGANAAATARETAASVSGVDIADLPPVLWAMKARDENDLTGVTQVLDVFGEDIVMLTARMEHHLACIARSLPQLRQDCHSDHLEWVERGKRGKPAAVTEDRKVPDGLDGIEMFPSKALQGAVERGGVDVQTLEWGSLGAGAPGISPTDENSLERMPL